MAGWGTACCAPTTALLARLKPGAYEDRLPRINLLLLYSGLMRLLQTVMFFELGKDPVLDAVPPARRSLLMARREGGAYRFDIRLRGEGETPFFDD